MPFGVSWKTLIPVAIAFAFLPPTTFLLALPILLITRYIWAEYGSIARAGEAGYRRILRAFGVRTQEDLRAERVEQERRRRINQHGDLTDEELIAEYERQTDPLEEADIIAELRGRRQGNLEARYYALVDQLDEAFFNHYNISTHAEGEDDDDNYYDDASEGSEEKEGQRASS